MEVNRVLRPGGYFVWSATPVYQKHQEDVEFWNGSFLSLFQMDMSKFIADHR
jgi:hypothetical protein